MMSFFRSINTTSRWFEAAESTGDLMEIRFGRKSALSDEVEWSFISHCDCDGIGGFARFLKECGVKPVSLPKTKYSNREIIKPLWNLIRRNEPDTVLALRSDWASANTGDRNSPQRVEWHLFTEEETELIRQGCRKRNVTVNSFLLKYLDQAARISIKKPYASIRWLVPVNLRGDINHDDETENHVSGIKTVIQVDDSPEDIQDQISERLSRGEHRANYLILALGMVLSQKMKARLLRKFDDKPEGNIGSFSNLGVWDSDHKINFSDACFFCPPVCKGQLLSAGCITFQNRLSLTIQAHSDFSHQPEMVRRWMEIWVGKVREKSYANIEL